MEEMQYRFYRLEDDLAYYIEKTPSEAITQEEAHVIKDASRT